MTALWRMAAALVLGAMAAMATAAETGPNFALGQHMEIPSWFKTSFLDLPEDIREARAAGRRLVIYVHQEGCPYCKRLLEDNFGQGEIAARTRKHFDVVTINIWGDQEVVDVDGEALTEKRFAVKHKVQFTPTLLFFNEDGSIALRVNGYYPSHRFSAALDYVIGRHHAKESLRDYIARVNPAPATGTLHSEPGFIGPPHDLSGKGKDKPLLVLFEQKQCLACDELHKEILGQPSARKLLAAYDAVVLDLWSGEKVTTPDGKRTAQAEWARSLGVSYAPSLVFFHDGGREVFREEAYFRKLHVESALDYVASGAWKEEPSFQRYIGARVERLRAAGER